jgi:hypothetical protein
MVGMISRLDAGLINNHTYCPACGPPVLVWDPQDLACTRVLLVQDW